MNSILVFNNLQSFLFAAAALELAQKQEGEKYCSVIFPQMRIEVPNVNDVWRVKNTLRENNVGDDEYTLEYVDNRAPRY